ncbi:adenine deaminase [Candidatus Micrarchaeota archaeon]|nr:adenine deaminase [Candidatus Micrarchaeota archaeon]
MELRGQVVDVFGQGIYPAKVEFGKRIEAVKRIAKAPARYILPGLVDCHMHVESTMLLPSGYARAVVRHGTVAAVADPHEIANVLGERGVRFMVRNGRRSGLKFFFGAPSCVPATDFETSGARLGPEEVGRLLSEKGISHLSEVMDYPGVIGRKRDVMAKIAAAKKYKKAVDGHAPGLLGGDLDRYISAGIGTDHECSTLEEAKEKSGKGMRILVREGSAAKNLSALYPILRGGRNMLCTDDMEPVDIARGHMDSLLRKCVKLGIAPVDAIRSCTRNPCEHYGLGTGLLRAGDAADITVVRDLHSFRVLETYIDGMRVYSGKKAALPRVRENALNNFRAEPICQADIAFDARGDVQVIGARDGELVTDMLTMPAGSLAKEGAQKIALINRYKKAGPAVGFIKGFGLKKGAFGGSVMHDSHNIGVVGADDKSICEAANAIIRMKGGLAVYDGRRTTTLPLPFAGLMSGEGAGTVARRHALLTKALRPLGCRMKAPFMTLSFMALLVIPHLKISDKGLFDADRFAFA